MRHRPQAALSSLALLAVLAPQLARADAPAVSAETAARLGPTGMADLVVPLLPQVVSIATVSYALKPAAGTPLTTPQSQMTSAPAAYDAKQTQGSGFIIREDGLIVTNQHVIDDGARITVTLSDNTRLKATLLAQDKVIDIAVLKVDAGHKLQPVRFADSESIKPGDRVIAVGNPLGLGESVSSGIVSALDRDIHTSPFDSYIQTDASINHGNSGGALFNLAGEVVGMNTALISAAGETGSVGLGFAIPGNDVQFTIRQMAQFGRVRPGWLGAVVQHVTADIADGLGLKEAGGSVVLSVVPDSPAARVGLRFGDVILAFDGKPVTQMRILNRAVAVAPLDASVPVSVWRNGERMTVPVKIVENPESAKAQKGEPPVMPPHMARADMGMQVATITDALRREFALEESDSGLVVTDVIPYSVAAERDISAGAVVLGVDRAPVRSLDEWHATMQSAWAGNRANMLVLLKDRSGRKLVALPTSVKPE